MGYKRPLTKHDLWKLGEENSTEYNSNIFENKLNPKKNTKYKGILLALMTTFWFFMVLMAILKLALSFLPYANPSILNWLIDYMSEGSEEPEWRGYLYACLMFIAPMVESILSNQYELGTGVIALRMRACITNAIYKKVNSKHFSNIDCIFWFTESTPLQYRKKRFHNRGNRKFDGYRHLKDS